MGYNPYLEEALRWLPDVPRDSAGIGGATPALTPPAQGPPARVLIAEDNGDMRAYLRQPPGRGMTMRSRRFPIERGGARRDRP